MKYWMMDVTRKWGDPLFPAVTVKGSGYVFVFFPKEHLKKSMYLTVEDTVGYFGQLLKKYPLIKNGVYFYNPHKKNLKAITEEEFFVELIKQRLK